MSQSRRRRGGNAKRRIRKNSYHPTARKDWAKSADKTLEVFLCFGHIVAAVTLVVEHLL